MNRPTSAVLLVALLVSACQKGLDPKLLTQSAEIFLQQGGLTVLSAGGAVGAYPCLRAVPTSRTTLGGLFGTSEPLVDFIDEHDLASVKRERSPSGARLVTVTPSGPYQSSWSGSGDFKTFCVGKLMLVKAEAVKDAQPLTAGAEQPYIVPGTPAQATRIAYRLEDVPTGTFVADLKAKAFLLRPGSMSPDDFGKELSAVAVLPVKPDGYTFTP